MINKAQFTLFVSLLLAFQAGVLSGIDLEFYRLKQNFSSPAEANIIPTPYRDIVEKLGATETMHRRQTVVAGALVAGNALGFTMSHLSDRSEGWLDGEKGLMVATDFITGFGLIYLALSEESLHDSRWYWILTTLSFATHLFRHFDYQLRAEDSFCSNSALYAINSVKLSAVVASGSTGLMVRFKLQLSESGLAGSYD